ncbi:DUF3245 domain-containing protein [Aspergillus mulundensis]|uniref:Uncharacterized protein n=1 Tax=Aspergillus mulundensis TaxID=1810919 RepID=A0A3D8QZV6_9EURO|nr:Uncharacterized protein DSM5745_08980 [Aspergillus mulundensis]RDW67114.1 Uncharacterized protein DSM5745_08980 [Aspergillus mulundensis]
MSLSKADTDIILNKANIALARSQRLVASWIPAAPATEADNAKTDAELQREEEEIFTAVPETLGLGAPLPSKAADGSWNRRELDSNDALRRQLLGRNYKKVMAEKEKARKATADSAASENPVSKGTTGHDQQVSRVGDDDDDEGRAALIGKKASSRKRKVGGHTEPTAQPQSADGEVANVDSEEPDERKAANSQEPKSKGRKKATSFLDEILAERSKKRKKR